MNGSNVSSNTHTVSPKQVLRMEEHIDGVVSKTKTQLENETREFFKKLAKNWADENAVDFANKVKIRMEEAIDDLGKRTTTLKGKICDIHNKYAGLGGKGMINPTNLALTPAIDTSIVKDTFDGDRYGFDNPQSVGLVFTDFSNLINKCNSYSEELKSDIASTNAFGNFEVKEAIERGASALMYKLEDNIRKLIKLSNETVESVIKKYESVSNNPEALGALKSFSSSLDLGNLGDTTVSTSALTAGFGIASAGTALLTQNDTHVVEGRFGGSNIATDLHAGGSNSIRDFSEESDLGGHYGTRQLRNGSYLVAGFEPNGDGNKAGFDKLVDYFGDGEKPSKIDSYIDEGGNLRYKTEVNGKTIISKIGEKNDALGGNASYTLQAADTSYFKEHGGGFSTGLEGGSNSTSALAAGSSYKGNDYNFFDTTSDSVFSGKLSNIDTSENFDVYGIADNTGTTAVINKVIDAYSDGTTPTNVHYEYHTSPNTGDVYLKTTNFDIGDKTFSKTTYAVPGDNDHIVFHVEDKNK